MKSSSFWKMVLGAVRDGAPGICHFAITSVCNARCRFCSFARDVFPAESRHYVSLAEAELACDILYRNGIRFLHFTGGEPLLNRDFTAMVAYAARIGMNPAVVTNGSLLTPKRIDALVDAGLAKVCISIDAATASVHDENRGLRGVSERIRRANAALKQRGISVTASVTMSRLVDYVALPEALRDMGFGAVTFSYPLRNLRSSFLSHAKSPLVEFTPEELCDAFEAVERVREHFPVLNPTASIRDMQRHVRGEPELFECLGGWKSFYLDWHLKLWRCHDWDRPLCDIRDFDGTQRMRDRCTACMVDCYRDSSVMQHVGVAMSDGIHAAARGDLRQAWAHWMDRRNVVSVRAAMHTLGIWRRAP